MFPNEKFIPVRTKLKCIQFNENEYLPMLRSYNYILHLLLDCLLQN